MLSPFLFPDRSSNDCVVGKNGKKAKLMPVTEQDAEADVEVGHCEGDCDESVVASKTRPKLFWDDLWVMTNSVLATVPPPRHDNTVKDRAVILAPLRSCFG